MGAMKDLDIWFNEKYNEYDDDTGEWKEKYRLFLVNADPKKGNGIRIAVVRKDEEDGNMTYMQDYYEGTDYDKDIKPLDMFLKVTGFIDDIMENMPK